MTFEADHRLMRQEGHLRQSQSAGYLVISVYVVFSGGFVVVLLDLLGNWGDCKIDGGSWIRGIQIWG
jgi:hypothetical protein